LRKASAHPCHTEEKQRRVAHVDLVEQQPQPVPEPAPDAEDQPYLSIVIPMYNEAERLADSLPRLIEYFEQQTYPHEYVMVDDGSSDGTVALARELFGAGKRVRILESRPNRGKGHAVKVGMLAARGKIQLFSDADLSTPPSEIERFLPCFDSGYKVVIGSRKMQGANITAHQPLWRESLGKVFTWLTNRIATRGISDITCGFKCFSYAASQDLFSRAVIDDWSFDAEILFMAQKKRYPIKEVPVTWNDRPGTKVRLWKDALNSIIGLARIRMNAMRGLYK
jgi:dolichyl-phosphate beta-glucosyltransferase